MAKLDDTFVQIEAGFQNPVTMLYQTFISDEFIGQIKLRRRTAGVEQHKVWVLTVGEAGQAPTATFYGHKPTDCIKQACTWRGIPSSRGEQAGAAT